MVFSTIIQDTAASAAIGMFNFDGRLMRDGDATSSELIGIGSLSSTIRYHHEVPAIELGKKYFAPIGTLKGGSMPIHQYMLMCGGVHSHQSVAYSVRHTMFNPKRTSA